MINPKVARRTALIGLGITAAWASSPIRALVRTGSSGPSPVIVDQLIARMSLEEKAGQLTLMAAAWSAGSAVSVNPPSGVASTFEQQVEEASLGQLTGVFNGAGSRMARIMQTAATTRSRLGIPMLFAADVIHGYRTIFPVPLAEAASFEPELARRTARAAAYEAAAAGIDWTFAPMVDIARDQRWGRAVEGAGEDVLLGNLFAAARAQGFQGEDLRAPDAMLACAKHFAAYGAAEAGLDYNTVDVSERTLREVYLPPFKAAFDAGAGSTMAAFNEISGIPAHANDWLLQKMLRDEWGFHGLVVSDYTGDEEMIAHGFAADAREAAKLAFLAGVDISMQSGFYRKYLPGLVASGEISMERLDASVRRVLMTKHQLGLFDDPFRRIDEKRERERTRTAGNVALARESARKSIVLLKNQGGLLPLATSGQRIALIGPFASGAHDLNGPWTVFGDNQDSVDLARGMQDAMGKDGSLSITPGSLVDEALPGGIEAAVAAARDADVVVLSVGESEAMSGEAQSRTSIALPPAQQALAEALSGLGKPMIVVLKNGRALELEGAVAAAPAILVTWFLGSQTGHGIADILFGKVSPSGRLPVSFPRQSGQQPYYYAHKPTGRPNPSSGTLEPFKARFRDISHTALFPFGHGLTYGQIEYDSLELSSDRLSIDGELLINARIHNRAGRSAEEVVQLYVRDRAASVTRPVRELKAFRKVLLRAGQAETVSFRLKRSDLLFIGRDLRPTVEAGVFDIWVAPSAEAEGLAGRFTLDG